MTFDAFYEVLKRRLLAQGMDNVTLRDVAGMSWKLLTKRTRKIDPRALIGIFTEPEPEPDTAPEEPQHE